MKTITTKKLNAGNYSAEYKGFKISIVHTNDVPNADWWYFTYIDLNGNHNGAEDTYSSKKIAVEAAVEWVDYLTTGVYNREILR